MKPKPHRVTSFDVAALAQVSQAAVSRTFTPGSSITPALRARVLEAARTLNYVPNSIASSLSTRRTGIVAMIIGDLGNPFYVAVMRSFSRRLQESGRQILVFTTGPDLIPDAAMMRVMRYQVDGVVLTSALISTSVTSLAQDRGTPIVLFNRYVPGQLTTCVRCDNRDGGRRMADAFLAAGARRFAVILGDPAATTSQDRLHGFLERLNEAGLDPGEVRQDTGFASYEGGVEAARRLLSGSRLDWPDALFCINDIMAMGTVDALRLEFDAVAPRDILLAGFDDIPEASRAPYRLTTMRQPIEAMVDRTLDLLAGSVEDGGRTPLMDVAISGDMVFRQTLPAPQAPAATLSAPRHS